MTEAEARVIQCARLVLDAPPTDEHDDASVELLGALVGLEMAMKLLDEEAAEGPG